MFSLVRFIIITFAALVVLGGISIIWPRIRKEPRPEFLSKVYQVSKKTDLGRKMENVLGVSTDKQIEPITIQNVTQSVLDSAQKSAQVYVQNIAVTYAVRQLVGMFNSLTPDQKNELKSIICITPTNSPTPQSKN